MPSTLSPLAVGLAGFMLGAGLIIAIGAQNAFVLRQGLRRERVLAVVVTCIVCDVSLISAGTVGLGGLVARFPGITSVAAWLGAAYLVFHGVVSLRSAVGGESLTAEEGGTSGMTVASAVGATLAVSLLNPHVYLDTVVLIGSIAAQYPGSVRVWFAVGAATASLTWFSALGFGARLLAPLFRAPLAWRILDVLVACVMFWIAAVLVLGQLR